VIVLAKKSYPKPIKTKEGTYECPSDKSVFETEKEYEKHCEEKHVKKK
jgi:uncharacterized C2H2 Zn-finger protein